MRREKAAVLTVVGLLVGLWGCGSSLPPPPPGTTGSSTGESTPPPSLSASITSISPTSAVAGSPDAQLILTGTFVLPQGTYHWDAEWSVNGSSTSLVINKITGSQMTVVVPAALLVAPVTAEVQVLIWHHADSFPTTQSNEVGFTVTPRGSGTALGFAPTGNMHTARSGHTATLLRNGKVLMAGGGVASAEVFDPATGSFSPVGSMSMPRSGATATLLPGGQVLVSGGSDSSGKSLASAEKFDPATATFSSAGNMTSARSGATATLLHDGMVLLAGGVDDHGLDLDTAELYDPLAGTFRPASGNMVSRRWGHTATLLANGKVLLAGGLGLSSAELFDPATSRFMATGSMSTHRYLHTATLLPNGRVLVLGGRASLFSLSSEELYDPGSGVFSDAGNLNTPRSFHTATLLRSGQVLVTGGVDWFSGPDSPESQLLSSAELVGPAGKSALTNDMNHARADHTATILVDGRVLVAGGKGSGATAELYKY